MESRDNRSRKPCPSIIDILSVITAFILSVTAASIMAVSLLPSVIRHMSNIDKDTARLVPGAVTPVVQEHGAADAVDATPLFATAEEIAAPVVEPTGQVNPAPSSTATYIASAPAAVSNMAYFTHTVQADEILACIAEYYCGNQNYFDEICAYNGLEDCHSVSIGDEILIPFSLDVVLKGGVPDIAQCVSHPVPTKIMCK